MQTRDIINLLNNCQTRTAIALKYAYLGAACGMLTGSATSYAGTVAIPALGGALDNPWQARAAGMMGGAILGSVAGLFFGVKKAWNTNLEPRQAQTFNV